MKSDLPAGGRKQAPSTNCTDMEVRMIHQASKAINQPHAATSYRDLKRSAITETDFATFNFRGSHCSYKVRQVEAKRPTHCITRETRAAYGILTTKQTLRRKRSRAVTRAKVL